jgi:hypothetical protein
VKSSIARALGIISGRLENTVDATRGQPLAARVLARKDELEDALVDLRRGDALERQAIETALATVYALMTGDIAHPSEVLARDAIAVRIAQPVQAMLWLDQQLIALDPRARVIGRPQPDQLRA